MHTHSHAHTHTHALMHTHTNTHIQRGRSNCKFRCVYLRSLFQSRCDVSQLYVWHDSFICATWSIHMCDMTCSYVGHTSFVRVTWLIHRCDAFICMCDVTHSHARDITHSYVWQDLFMEWRDSVIGAICLFVCVTWLIHMRDMTHRRDMYSYVWHDVYS